MEASGVTGVFVLGMHRSGASVARGLGPPADPTPSLAAPAAGGRSEAPSSVVVFADSFPALSETFVTAEVKALRELGYAVRVEATKRANPVDHEAPHDIGVSFLGEESLGRRLRDLARLLCRHPLGSVRDLASRRRWREEEDVPPLLTLAPLARRLRANPDAHLHAHFLAEGALTAMRLSRLVGCPYSVTGHAYDIFRKRRNLSEKLERAAFATSGTDYTVSELRRIAGPGYAKKLHKVVMGVDGARFRRNAPYPGGRAVVGVGRLVRKKGFQHLLEAAALLEHPFPLDGVALLGDGRFGKELRRRARRLSLTNIEWLGALPHAAVRDLLERADLLVMPSIVTPSGDRDGIPTVVKEALAMEVPVVATDVSGLPEFVREPWGLTVPQGDASALADAIREVLSRPREARVEMGRAGREFVLATCDLRRETEKLARLIEASARSREGSGHARASGGSRRERPAEKAGGITPRRAT